MYLKITVFFETYLQSIDVGGKKKENELKSLKVIWEVNDKVLIILQNCDQDPVFQSLVRFFLWYTMPDILQTLNLCYTGLHLQKFGMARVLNLNYPT